MKPASQSHGFTLLELLVCMAVISTLSALAFPALNSAIEASRNTKCQINLQQIGLAMKQYDTAEGRLPAAKQIGPKAMDLSVTKQKAGPFVLLLRYLDQLDMARKYDFARSPDEGANAVISKQTLQVFACPSMNVPDNPPAGWGSYGVCTGTGACRLPVRYDGTPDPNCHNGAIIDAVRGRTSIRGIAERDGTAKTLMVGELDYGLTNLAQKTNNQMTGGGTTRWAPAYVGVTWCSLAGVFNSDRLVTGFMELETFRSDHPGGANFVMVDGTVRWFSDNTHPDVLKRLAHRSDGQPSDEL